MNNAKSINWFLAVILILCISMDAYCDDQSVLKEVFNESFMIGGAFNRRLVTGQDQKAADIAIKHLNTCTSENDMKWSLIHPQPGHFNWDPADKYVHFAETNHMFPIGHCLVWHSQVPKWVFNDDTGNRLTRDALLNRMKDHIFAVAGRYKGRIKGWDVVNEALNDDGTLRQSLWNKIISEGKSEQKYDHIAKAFQYAHEANPEAELYYNDYNLSTKRVKCDGAVAIVKYLRSKGLRIDAVGMQLHAGLDYPEVEDLEYAIKSISETGVKVMITELDIRIQKRGYQGADVGMVRRKRTDDPEFLSAETQKKLADKYSEIFTVLLKHKDVIPRVTFWGVYDETSWIGGSPLLFDSNCQPKRAFDAVIELGIAENQKASKNSNDLAALKPDSNFYIFLCFGQSNMEGYPGIPQEEREGVDDRFQVLAAVDNPELGRKKGNWYKAIPPLSRGYAGLCPADYFGRTMVANLPQNVRVGVINVSVGGCKIELFNEDTREDYIATVPSWMPGILKLYNDNPYEHLVDMAKLAQRDGVIKGILLHQGESNTNDKDWPEKVHKVYDKLINDLSLKAEEVPLLAGEVVHADQGGVCASMNTIIDKLPDTIPNSYVIPSSGCTCCEDHLHFDPAGYKELGKRYAEKMLLLLQQQ